MSPWVAARAGSDCAKAAPAEGRPEGAAAPLPEGQKQRGTAIWPVRGYARGCVGLHRPHAGRSIRLELPWPAPERPAVARRPAGASQGRSPETAEGVLIGSMTVGQRLERWSGPAALLSLAAVGGPPLAGWRLPGRRRREVGPAGHAPLTGGCAVCAVRRWGAHTAHARPARFPGRTDRASYRPAQDHIQQLARYAEQDDRARTAGRAPTPPP